MDENSKKSFKAGVWYTVSDILVKSLSIITIPIFTRLLSKADYGAFNNFTSWLNIAAVFVPLKLEASLIRAQFDYKEEFDKYIASMLALTCVSAVFWGTVVNIFHIQFSKWFSMELCYINLMLMFLVFQSAVIMFQMRERFRYRYKINVFIGIIVSVSTVLVSLPLVLLMENKLKGRIIGCVLPTILIGAVLFFYFFMKSKGINVRTWKYAMDVSLPYIPHTLSLTVLASMDRVMITNFCGNEDTALYSLAYSYGALITMIGSSINSAYGPWLAERLYKGELDTVREKSKPYTFIPFVLGVGVMLISPEILYVLGGKSYLSAKYVSAPIAAGCIFQFMYTMFVNVEQFKRKTIGMAIGSMSAAVLNYVLNLIMIPRFGYVAAAYTTLIGYAWLLAVHMFLVKRIGYGKAYDYKFMGAVSVVVVIITALVNLVYYNDVIRWMCIMIYIGAGGAVMIRKRKLIAALLRTIVK